MKLQRTTLILLFLALGLGGFIYIYEQGTTQRQESKAQQQIFAFTEQDVQSLQIKTAQQTLDFERTTNNKNKWLMKSPSVTPASEASVSYLLDLLARATSDRTLQIPATQLAEYGLMQPQATITVKLKNQQTYQLFLGKPDFSGNFLYAYTGIKPDKNVNLFLVSLDFNNAVNRDLSEWKIANDTQSQQLKTP